MEMPSNIGELANKISGPIAVVAGSATGLLLGSGNVTQAKYTGLAMVAALGVKTFTEMFSEKRQGSIPDSIIPLGFSIGGGIICFYAEKTYRIIENAGYFLGF
ncbi:hypothetical protein J4212_00750 [Candidatus Woesearchaeota archaeon]|nr:hypothetical protein [Candidatus Woesearchaeota archaeon]